MDYSESDLLDAKVSLESTLKKIEKAIISLEEKQLTGGNYKSQITLSKNRVKALSLSIYLIDKELCSLN